MDYIEKRKNGRKRILQKKMKEIDKRERIANAKDMPIAIPNEKIYNSIYTGLTLNEKKLYKYIQSYVKKGDDKDTNYLLFHNQIKELINHNFTAEEIHTMLDHISSSLKFRTINEKGEKEIISIPIFKFIKTHEDRKSTEFIFNELYCGFIFLTEAEKGHFLKYKLENVMKFKCLHSPELFELLLAKTREKRIEIVNIPFDIEELKELLDCKGQETKHFLNQVIKKSIEDIKNSKQRLLGDTIDYKYDKIKKIITFYTENIDYMLKLEN